ncbi:calcium/hydrogen antiporter [Kluyveromyces lactis]|uniref:KLLA0E21033p n=1 Tax=Kluyveromyces lactis (strain ATCC 8585 / CBS 2359 / DSM 70799 / NBRC 1267 / NRRL Y-1140 / WM37) TaxID=284590 RepID=Q6CMD8_KLULA|nr:uncharacterized protein KLLA0_E21033g [Kluyveromyces lactis]CAG99988.1 KLLA0E21033p [Kluyveromyces lactis]|eukprot:XP_454901.1 uncharacterized protein KLLA0_E21033g [Kluyveromyces lactis]
MPKKSIKPVKSNSSEGTKRIFSVDDDAEELERDYHYLEGVKDGLKLKRVGTLSSKQDPTLHRIGSRFSVSEDNDRIIVHDGDRHLVLQEEQRKNGDTYDGDEDARDGSNSGNTHDGNKHAITAASHNNEPNSSKKKNKNDIENDYDENPLDTLIIDDDSESSNIQDIETGSISSVESYTLRERQEAINKTHPFGIRIWKPALYKKKRSVQQAADEDIHETKIRNITLGVQITNLIWSFTVGLFLFLIFTMASCLVLIFGGFTGSAIEYSLVFYRLGRYLLWPFGKIVLMKSDAQYLVEDQDEGISAQQFYKWITNYSNRLFFHESQAINDNNASTNNSNNFSSSQNARANISNNDTSTRNNSNNIITARNNINNHRQDSYGSIPIITERTDTNDDQSDEENGHLHRRLFGRGKWTIGRFIFYFMFHIVVQPVVMLLSLTTWLFVFTIPMSNILWNLMYHCRKHPLALRIIDVKSATSAVATTPIEDIKGQNVLLCTFRCAGLHYYKFTVDGTNVMVMNLIALVIFTIFDFYAIKNIWQIDTWLTDGSTIFMLCLLSIIPLAFYIGQAVASISAQSSMGVAAVINAFFSTIVEIFLYCVALQQEKGLLVEGSLIGSILAAVLLLPGMSMCGGAFKRKTQRYNPASAGVSCAMLIFSMVVMFIPSVLYEIYGEWDLLCNENGEKCHFVQPQLKFDKMYSAILRPIVLFCTVALFLQYIIGMWFTLRTHAKLIWELPIAETKDVNNDQSQLTTSMSMSQNSFAPLNKTNSNILGVTSSTSGANNAAKATNNCDQSSGHDAPNWSKTKSTCILLGATFLYAIIAEILVDCVDQVLEQYPAVNPKFLGLTIFALVPNTTEFLNAISFAVNGNVALSMEIGSAYALQVCLLQIPALVIFSMLYVWGKDLTQISIRDRMFPMVFPRWDLLASVVSVFLFTYLYAEGKSNYFKGSILILLYLVVIFGFYLQEIIDDDFWDISLFVRFIN